MRQWKSPRRTQHQTSWRTHMRQQTRDIMEDHCVLAASSLAARTANTTNLESRQTRTTHKDHFLAARSRAARIIACDKSNSEQHGACTQRMITIFSSCHRSLNQHWFTAAHMCGLVLCAVMCALSLIAWGLLPGYVFYAPQRQIRRLCGRPTSAAAAAAVGVARKLDESQRLNYKNLAIKFAQALSRHDWSSEERTLDSHVQEDFRYRSGR